MATAADTLAQLERKDLEATAEKLKVKTAGISDSALIQNIIRAAMKMQIQAENMARAEIKKEAADVLGVDPKAKKRPSPQDVAIRASRKVIVQFHNLENPSTDQEDGADLHFTAGTYTFHLFDGHRFCMPECLTTYKPLDDKNLVDTLIKFWRSTGMTAERAKAQAYNDLVQMSLARRCTFPVYKEKEGPMGNVESVRVKDRPRFRFEYIGPASDDMELGALVEPDAEELMSDAEIIAAASA